MISCLQSTACTDQCSTDSTQYRCIDGLPGGGRLASHRVRHANLFPGLRKFLLVDFAEALNLIMAGHEGVLLSQRISVRLAMLICYPL
jgi:hypothetical protein